jgi:uncharacterized protein with NRDE domain
MCTVTYVPQKNGGFTLTSNRDEAPHRSPQNITQTNLYQRNMLFPRDTTAGGTWIATSDRNRVVCLLNGAFDFHRHEPPYRKSRGLMVLEAFEYPRLADFTKNYDFCDMEPFTFILSEGEKLIELRWDGTQKYMQELNHQAMHIWASATLYTSEVQQKRVNWFEAWRKEQEDYHPERILDFHRTAGDGDPWNDVMMNRQGIVQTVSITQIINDGAEINMHYHDLVNDNLKQAKISLEGEVVEST